MAEFYNLDLDDTLGGVNPSDTHIPSQKAVKNYADTKIKDVLVNGESAAIDGVASIPIGSSDKLGVYKAQASWGINVYAGILYCSAAQEATIDRRNNGTAEGIEVNYQPITPYKLDYAVKKSITTSNQTLTTTEKTNACAWLGAAEASAIPTVNDATLTIQKNGTTVNTFTANASSDVTANITVPTKISDLENDSNFADKDLSNLSTTGKNLGNWSTNVSNCIVEIPQDINLTLSNGTLTLKHGSKVYTPDGTTYTLIGDKTATQTTNDTRLYFYNGLYIEKFPVSQCYSGATAPSGYTYMFWYDTANNVVKKTNNGGTTWEIGWSLPFAKITATSGAISSIDEVFNGFGHIGHTVFALPGVKALIPLGRNADGTLKSRLDTLASVKTSDAYTSKFMFNAAAIAPAFWTNYAEQDTQPTFVNGNGTWYNTRENKMYQITGGVLSVVEVAYVLDVVLQDADHVKSVTPKLPFMAVDYNNVYTKDYVDTQLSGKANTALSNLTSTGKNLGNWSTNVSNCIIEIPQDINLTLSSGTLTLKAGSKVYIPNGGSVFDTNMVANDLTITNQNNGTYMLFLTGLGGTLMLRNITQCSSGTTAPTPVQTYSAWYDTTNNIMKYTTSSTTWNTGASLPIALVTVSSGAISSIDKVFNGFGYIGSTVFALPGVKGLIPNGLNADGSLKNNTMTIQNVLTRTIPSNTGWHYLSISASGTSCDFRTNYFQGTSNPASAQQFSVFYNYDTNLSYLQATVDVWTQQNNFICPFRIEHESSSPYKIISMQPATVFHAVDYSDTEFIAHQAMPSSEQYTSYSTSTASDTTFIAPVDGYVYVQGQVVTAYGYCILALLDASGNIMLSTEAQTPASTGVRMFLPVSKGDTFKIEHSNFTINIFRFVYANGAK